MGFSVYCEIKGCRKEMEPYLDRNDNKVYCSECDGEVTSITSFAKNQMISLGQVKRTKKTQQAFSVKCGACNKENPPKLKDNDLICSSCDSKLNLSAPFINTIKEFLKTQIK